MSPSACENASESTRSRSSISASANASVSGCSNANVETNATALHEPDKRPCMNELQKDYCVKIKLIALD